METTLNQLLPNKFLDVLVAAGNATGRSTTPLRTADLGFRFDRTNSFATDWARKHSAKLMTDVSRESRLAIRGFVRDAFRKQIPPSGLARMIRKVIGLTSEQADAVLNLRDRAIASPGRLIRAGKVRVRVPKLGPSEKFLEKITSSYTDRLKQARAMNIARTETMNAANEGQMQMWEQAIGKGLIRADVKTEFIVTPDDRACPICTALEGKTSRLRENIPGTDVAHPPIHPGCRCAQGLVIPR